MMTRRTGVAAATIFLAGVLFLFHSLSPLALDDYGFLVRLKTVSDIIAKSIYQYHTWDGRLTGYILNHAILYLPGPAANSLLALAEVGLVYAIAMHVLGPGWKDGLTGRLLLGVACLLWLSIPDVGQIFFWKTGTPYAIIPALYLLFLWPYRLLAAGKDCGARVFFLLIPLAVFCGLADFHNTVAIALLACVLAWCAMRAGGKWSAAPFLPPAVLLVCFAVIYKAPGNLKRLEALNPDFLQRSRVAGIVEHLGNQASIQAHYAWEYALAAVSLFLLWRYRKSLAANPDNRIGPAGPANAANAGGWLRTVTPGGPLYSAAAFFLLAQAVQMVFMFSPSPADRVYASSVIFMIIAALILHKYALARLKSLPAASFLPFRAYWAVAFAACASGLLFTGGMYAETKAYTDALDAKIAAARPGSDLEVPPGPYLAGRYLFYGRQCGVQKDPTAWANRQIAHYNNLASIMLERTRATLAMADEAAGSFHGVLDGDVLTFAYTPARENAEHPFYLALPAAPATFFQRHGLAYLERPGRNTFLFRYALEHGFDKMPFEATGPGGTISGTLTVVQPDLATRGYIVHYRGAPDGIVAVVPLAGVK